MDHQPATGNEPDGTRAWNVPFALPSWVGNTARRSWAVFRLVVLTVACGIGAALIVALAVSIVVTALANGTD